MTAQVAEAEGSTIPMTRTWDEVTVCLGIALVSSLLAPTHVVGVPLKALLAVLGAASAFALSLRRSPSVVSRGDLAFLVFLLASVASLFDARNGDAALLALSVPLAMFMAHRATFVSRDGPESKLPVRQDAGTALQEAPEEKAPRAARLRATPLLDLYVFAAFVVACFGCAGYLRWFMGTAPDPLTRSAFLATPFFDHPYLAVQAIAPAAPLALFAARKTRSRPRRIGLAFASALIVAFSLFSLSRAAMLALVLGVTIAGMRDLDARSERRGASLTLRWRIIAVGVALILAIVVGNLVFARFRAWVDPSLALVNFMRVLIWQDTLAMISDHLPLGVGVGNFGFEFGRYHAAARPVAHAHDQWLHSLAETGSAGLIGAVLVFLVPWLDRARRVHEARRQRASGQLVPLPPVSDIGPVAATLTLFCIAWFESPLAFMGSALPFSIVTAHLIGRRRIASSVTARRSQAWVTSLAVPTVLTLSMAVPAWWRVARSGYLGQEAQWALARGDLDSSQRLLESAQAISRALPELDTLRARAALAAKDFPLAIAALEAHEERVPGLPDHLVDLATALREVGEPRRAIDPLSFAIPRAIPESVAGIRIERLNMFARSQAYEEVRLEAIEMIARGVHLVEPLVLLRLAEALTNLRRDRNLAFEVLDEYSNAIAPTRSEYVDELRRKLSVTR